MLAGDKKRDTEFPAGLVRAIAFIQRLTDFGSRTTTLTLPTLPTICSKQARARLVQV